jgi:3-oxoadipate enol-lactonase
MQTVRLNDVTLHYQILAAQPGKPVMVFVNSLGTDFRIWRDVIVDFAGEVAMIAYDKRGHGLSSLGNPPYKMDDHVADLEGLLDHLKLTNVIICGVSVGGLIAQGLYAKRPDLVRAMILCDTGHKIGNDEMWNSRIAAIENSGIETMAEPILERWFSKDFRASRKDELEIYRNMLVRQPVEGYTGTGIAIRDTDYTEVAKSISVPCLCVVGSEDGSTPPALVEELAGLISGAEFEIIEGAGHLPSIEKPKELAGLIRRFMKRLSASKTIH